MIRSYGKTQPSLFVFVAFSLICPAALAQGPARTSPGRLYDPYITRQQVMSVAEFESMAFASAGKAGIAQKMIAEIVRDFEASCIDRVVRPQEWRYSLLSLLYRNKISYEKATRFLLDLQFSPVDTGFLDHIQTLIKAPAAVSGTPYLAGRDDVKGPRALDQPLPSYTPEARQARVVGTVVIQAVISRDGRVTRPAVLRGLGYGLDESAIETLLTKWRFEPGTRDGIPVDVQANVEVSFRLY